MEELSKNKQKWIRSLHLKKYRDQEQAFIVEGTKNVEEALKFAPKDVLFIVQLKNDNFSLSAPNTQRFSVSPAQMKEISALSTPNNILAVMRIASKERFYADRKLTLILDDIQNPGNLGTIWRLADWYGITEIICSLNSVDCYNPKVIQASMGAFTRVSIKYFDLMEYLSGEKRTIYGAFMNGENIYKTALENDAILILGNEGKGISADLEKIVTSKLSIPNFGNAESLNVGIAAAIMLSEFSRQL